MEFGAVEPVPDRVSQQPPEKWICIKGRIDLFEIKTTPFLKDTGDFLKTESPLLQVMDDSEIKHRIETCIPIGQVLGVGHKEDSLIGKRIWSSSESKGDHGRVNVYGVNTLGVKVFAYQPRAVTPSAADLQKVASTGHGSHLPEVPAFNSLNEPSHRAVHPYSFGPVDLHPVLEASFPSIL